MIGEDVNGVRYDRGGHQICGEDLNEHGEDENGTKLVMLEKLAKEKGVPKEQKRTMKKVPHFWGG